MQTFVRIQESANFLITSANSTVFPMTAASPGKITAVDPEGW
jgi:hypothetical protein